MKISTFENREFLVHEAVSLLQEYMGSESETDYAVMLTGGRTPLDIYGIIADDPFPVSARLRILLSDERHVPDDSSESNYRNIKPMLNSLEIPEDRVMHVDTGCDLEESAIRYERDIAAFVEAGGEIELGILGLGSDGHVASLFSDADIESSAGRYAVAIRRKTPPDRVSVSAELLKSMKRIVFLVTGEEKIKVIDELISNPHGVTVFKALGSDADRAELWFAL